jgi:hypothetical protein
MTSANWQDLRQHRMLFGLLLNVGSGKPNDASAVFCVIRQFDGIPFCVLLQLSADSLFVYPVKLIHHVRELRDTVHVFIARAGMVASVHIFLDQLKRESVKGCGLHDGFLPVSFLDYCSIPSPKRQGSIRNHPRFFVVFAISVVQ